MPDMGRRVRIGLVGTGSFARAHLAALAQLDRVEIAYVVGSDLQRAASLARTVEGAVPAVSLAKILTDPDLEAVDICNRTPRHAPDALAALSASKHVHVDKPAALSLIEFDAMVEAANRNRVSLCVGQTARFQPIVTSVHQAIQRGEIGQPRLAHISWYTGHVWPDGWRGWQLDVSQSGGHPVHNGVHILDTASWLLGSPVVEIMTQGFRIQAPEMSMPDSFVMIARFASGALATLELCYALRQPGRLVRRLLVVGDRGTAFHDTELDPGLSSPAHTAAPASVENALAIQLGAWVDSLSGGPAFPVTVQEARATLAAALAAQQSLDTAQPVRI